MKKSLLTSILWLSAFLAFADEPHTPKWTISNPFERKEFIENLGQYSLTEKNIAAKDIVFGTRQDGLRYFFMRDGIWVMNYKPVKRTEREIEKAMKDAGVKETAAEGKQEKEWMWKFVPEFHQMQFIGVNPGAEVYGVNEQSAVHNFYTDKPLVAHAWKKLVYKNLYPNIDMELVFPEDKTGFKYSFIVHPGGNPSLIKIKYPENNSVGLASNGNIHIQSALGEFIDHAPVANEANTAKPVDIAFALNNGTVGFSVEDYDVSAGLIIDPWTSTPVFTGSNNAFDVDWDNGGNCYVYGGVAPFQVLKFNAAGTMLWSYTTTFTSAWYYGDFAVDHNTGAAYIVDGFNGSGAQARKINTNGVQTAAFMGNSLFQEMWRIAFSRCTNQAVIAGGGTSNPSYTGCHLDTNLSAMFPVNVINSSSGLHDMWGVALDAFGSAYFCSAKTQFGSAGYDNIIYKVPTPALTPITWQTPEGYSFIEVASVNYAPGPPNGFNGTTISNANLYTYDSYVLKKWNTATGAMITSLNVNGSSASTMTYGGIDADDCDNLFLGVNNTIRQYNSALSLVGTIAAPANVYDCQLGKNNILYSCGMGFVMATQLSLLPCSILNTTDAITNGGCSTPGSATITVTGGTAPYSVTWNSSPPQTGMVLSSVPSGTYIATIIDNSCIKQTTYDTVVITAGGSAALTVNSGTVCPGNPLQLVVSGASTYTWTASSSLSGSLNGATVTATPTITTSYTVMGSVTGCTGSVVATVTVNPKPTVTASSGTICQGQQTATLTASGASTYVWSPPTGLSGTTGTSVTASPPSTTIYTVTGTDAAGCVNTGTTMVTVNTPPSPTISSNSPVCVGSTLTLNTSVGTSWSWSGPNAFTSTSQNPSIPNVQTTATGNYSLTVTDANGCTGSTTFPVTINPLPNPTAATNSPICANQNLSLTSSGGVSYSWAGPGSFSSTQQNPVITGASTNATGVYTVTVTDANSCVNSTTVSATVNALPIPTATGATVCANGTINLSSTGGTSYSWSGPNAYSSTAQNPSIANATTAMSGSYAVTVTDANNCSSTATANVAVNTALLPTASNNSPVCDGAAFTLSCNLGVTWSWNGPGGFTSANQNPTVSLATPAMSGIYTVTTTDANGCTGTGTTSVTVNPLPSPTASGTTPLCVNQNLNLSSTGGVSYAWSGPSSFTSSQQNPSVNGVTTTANGVYTVTVTDANNCVNTATVSITVNPLPIPTATGATVCANGTINLSSTGGTSYSWSGPNAYSSTAQNPSISNATTAMSGSYIVTVTDANNCSATATANVTVNTALVPNPTNNSPVCDGAAFTLSCNLGVTWSWSGPGGFTSANQNPTVSLATPAMSGIYTVTTTDANGCVGSGITSVTVNPLPTPTATGTTPLCVNQNLNLGSTGGVSYSWSGPSSFSSLQQNPSVNGVTLSANGIYTVTVTDANNCVNTATVTITVNPLPVVTATGATVCANGTINLSSTGGVSYSWTGPNLFTSNAQNPSITNATAAMGGAYVVTATDANNCSSSNTANVMVNALPVPSAGSNSPVCAGNTLNLNCNMGVTWSWSGPNAFTSSAQNPSITNVTTAANGIYTVSVTDANGCGGTTTTNVIINPLPVPVASNNGPLCTGSMLTLSGNGGTTYSWAGPANYSSNQQNPNVSPVNISVNGTYTVTVTDVNGCVSTATTTVVVYPLPILTANSGTICIGSTTVLMANGAQTYTWTPAIGLSSNTGSAVTASPVSSSTYVITGTDANGCVNTVSSSVLVNALPVVSVNTGTICIGQTKANLTAGGAVSYVWAPTGSLSAPTGSVVTANPGSTANYTVTGTDANGCVNTATTSVLVNPLPVLSVSPQTISGCAPLCSAFTNTTSATGTCSWNFGDGTTSSNCQELHCFTGQGTFLAVLTMIDANGCVGTASASVNVYPVPDADFNAGPQPTSIFDPVIHFTDASNGAVINSWSWNFGDANSSASNQQNPVFTYSASGSYPVTLTVVSDKGCKDSTIKIVKIDDEYSIYVPNAFSPNGDGVNDLFMAKAEGIKDFKIYIFDRWGNMIFYSEDINKGWDGTIRGKGGDIVQEDVYVWKIECKNYKGEAKQLSGTVSLLK